MAVALVENSALYRIFATMLQRAHIPICLDGAVLTTKKPRDETLLPGSWNPSSTEHGTTVSCSSL